MPALIDNKDSNSKYVEEAKIVLRVSAKPENLQKRLDGYGIKCACWLRQSKLTPDRV